MEQIINYRDIPTDKRIDILNALERIGFFPAYGGVRTMQQIMEKSVPGSGPQFYFVFRENELIGYNFLIGDTKKYKAFPWLAISNMDEQKLTVCEELMKIQIAFFEELGMKKIAVYGKGGIGKSTTVSTLAVALAEKGYKVMQIGCDPKADSTVLLRHGEKVETVLDLVRTKKDNFTLEDIVKEGFAGVCCVEAGGPSPGLGCAGRGIIAALETLEKKGAYEKYCPDVVIYDGLGDVVCGGFSMPMRRGYADKVFVITSGENMAIHAAANIAMAVENFKDRGYAHLGGLILIRRNVKNEEENKVYLEYPAQVYKDDTVIYE